MLWNPKLDVKVDLYSLKSFIAWLKKQPPNTKYDYANCEGLCLIGQYLTSCGMDMVQYGMMFRECDDHLGVVTRIKIADGKYYDTPQGWTFGAALQRARECLRSL